MLNHDFTERNYQIQYFEWMDILAILGGFNASLGPLFGTMLPIFMLNFLY